jgi:hypothetical protein
MSDTAMSDPTEDAHMQADEATLLLRQLLQKIEDMSDREKETSARMKILETSRQVPSRMADAAPTPTTTPSAEASDLPIHAAQKPRLSLPHPPTFSGNKSQWRGWKLEMEGKIEEDAPAIGSLKAQLRYIFMRLEGAAKTNVTTFYEMQLRQDSPNPCQLLERLELLYGERNRKQKAIQNLHSIRQREDETFISFYPRFEKEIANANAEGWDDDAKISYLRNALTYARFAQRCVDVSNDMELYGQWTKKKAAGSGYTAGYTLAAAPTPTLKTNIAAYSNHQDMMEWEPTQPATTQVNAVGLRGKTNMNGFPSKRLEDRELLGKRAKWVNQEEIDA